MLSGDELMAYLGIGYSGSDPEFLRNQVEQYRQWLMGERVPHFFGDRFLVLYDSNIAREFARKCLRGAGDKEIAVYPMSRPLE
jgi:hypothetical protein